MNYVEMRAVHSLPLDMVVPDPNQPRLDKPKAEILEIGNSIKQDGQKMPIIVHWEAELEKFQIGDGECRGLEVFWSVCAKSRRK